MKYLPKHVRSAIAKQLRAQLDPALYHVVSDTSIILAMRGKDVVLSKGVAVYRKYTESSYSSYPIFVMDAWDASKPLHDFADMVTVFMHATLTECLFVDVPRNYYLQKEPHGDALAFHISQDIKLASVPATLSLDSFIQEKNATGVAPEKAVVGDQEGA